MLTLLIALFMTSQAQAQGVSPYKIVSLYQKEALVTERFLPFQILTLDNRPVTIESVEAPQPCYGMVDPHRAHIALFFCTEETASHFSINIRDQGRLQVFKTPDFSIRKLAILSSTPDPDKPVVPDSPGKILYNTNCASCHTASNKMVETTTVVRLKDLFAGRVRDENNNVIDSMTKFNNFFTDAQLNDLVKYINEEL
jgi:hypothetical protein